MRFCSRPAGNRYQFTATAGLTYYISAGGARNNQVGTFRVAVTRVASGELCTSPWRQIGVEELVSGDTTSAAPSGGYYLTSGRDHWYSFQGVAQTLVMTTDFPGTNYLSHFSHKGVCNRSGADL